MPQLIATIEREPLTITTNPERTSRHLVRYNASQLGIASTAELVKLHRRLGAYLDDLERLEIEQNEHRRRARPARTKTDT